MDNSVVEATKEVIQEAIKLAKQIGDDDASRLGRPLTHAEASRIADMVMHQLKLATAISALGTPPKVVVEQPDHACYHCGAKQICNEMECRKFCSEQCEALEQQDGGMYELDICDGGS